MMRAAVLLVSSAVAVSAQQGDALRTLTERGDSVALATGIRQQPANAREALAIYIARAGRSPPVAADSALRLARRLAAAYVAVWDDSFPLLHVARFSRMTTDQRAAKVRGDSVRLAGNAALGSRGVDAAIALWRDALRRAVAIADTDGMAAAIGNIGAGFFRDSQLDSATAYLTRAERLARAIGDNRTAGNALGTLASVARERGDFRRAQESYVQALELRTRIGDVRGAAADHTNLGLMAETLGQLKDARAHYMEALAIADKHQLDEAAAAALLNLGNVASTEAEYVDAMQRYQQALSIYRRLGSDADVALVLHDVGLLAVRRGDYRTAQARLMEALALFARVGTLEDRVQVRRDLASVSAAMGDLRAALSILRRANEILGSASDQDALAAGIALARADVYVQLNTFAEADREYARAEALYRRAGDWPGTAEAQQGRAMLLIERKQYARAAEQLRSVAQRQSESGDRRSTALTQLLIGRAEQLRGDTSAARLAFERARATLSEIGDPVGEASAHEAIGQLDLDTGAPLAAAAEYRAGLARLVGREVPTVSWQLHAGLGSALHARGALADAAVELREATAEAERVADKLLVDERRSTFLADKWNTYEALALVEYERGDVSAAFATSERLRARQMLALLSRGRVQRSVKPDSVVLEHEQDLRTRISELTRRLETEERSVNTLRGPALANKGSDVTRESLAHAQGEYTQLLLELRDDAGIAPIVRSQVAEWRAVSTRLRRGQALLTYFVGDSTTLVFVVTPDTMRAIDLGINRRALAPLIDFARGTLGRPQTMLQAPWRAPMRRLYRSLIEPIEKTGLLADVRQLVIVPHAELHYLPFAALIRPGAKDEFLIERFDVGYAPSASTWLRLGQRASPSPPGDRVLAFAPRSRTLPGSRDEVNVIRALYGGRATVLTDGAASEKAFRMSAGQYGIVHLATFGVLNQHNPLFSFVDLSRTDDEDGRLEVHEVLGMSLPVRLLVLSACQTALASGATSDVPAGDDWVGLVRAFLGAGAENVIATLWAVEDRTTARVMERLHKRLRDGESELAALSRAQRETLLNPQTSAPFYWAGFVLVGAT